jgi:hypothetical protein
VIKTAIIFVLLILLIGGAFLSRPTKSAFEAYFREQSSAASQNPIGKLFAGFQSDRYLGSIDFKDRYLWVEVRHEGKTQFVGVFSRFFAVNIGDNAKTATPSGATASGD